MKKETSDVELYDFYIKLCQHDWLYEYSDDHRKWLEGKENYELLKNLSKRGEEYEELWDAYAEYVDSQYHKPKVSTSQPEIIYKESL